MMIMKVLWMSMVLMLVMMMMMMMLSPVDHALGGAGRPAAVHDEERVRERHLDEYDDDYDDNYDEDDDLKVNDFKADTRYQ